MIVVRVELHSAMTRKVSELARLHICNIGGTDSHGSYRVAVLRGRSKEDLDRGAEQRAGVVFGHARLSLHVWHLVAKALKELKYGT